MKKAKLNKVTTKKEMEIEDSYSIKNLIVIILVLVLILGIFYFITTLVVKPRDNEKLNSNAVIDSQMITLNHLLDRKQSEYYVLAIKPSLYQDYSNVNYQDLYNKYINEYLNNEDSIEFYKVNLDDALNKNYLSDKTNIRENIEDLKLSDETLFKISNGKIEKTFIGNEEILKELSNLS